MLDVVNIEEQSYILARSRPPERTLVLKQGEAFGVFDQVGDIRDTGLGEQGLYHDGTRFLSHMTLALGNVRPLLLSSAVRQDNVLLAVDLTNPDISRDSNVLLQRGTLHFYRSRFLWRGVCYERLNISNYGLSPVEIEFQVDFDADYRDVFEVRGQKREHRGRYLPTRVQRDRLVLGYEGLDGISRTTAIACSPEPSEVSEKRMKFIVALDAHGETGFLFSIVCQAAREQVQVSGYNEALSEASASVKAAAGDQCQISTSNEQFNEWMSRSRADLGMMVTFLPTGPYPFAGVPWFSTPFGRDAIITALSYLWIDPSMTRGVLAFLSQTQATEINPEQEAEPGKILHEARNGEMARLGEIAFGRYYGSVDSTPLYVLLAGAYFERTADVEFIHAIWPNVARALEWIDTYGDADGDGFVEYAKHSAKGLVQQGWKDSNDSVFHEDGRIPDGPIALCEVQAYVYAAKIKAAELCMALGRFQQAEELRTQADRLRRHFEDVFWMEDRGSYALALDGEKKPCRVRTSNAGHCLFGCLASPAHAQQVAAGLMSSAFYSGWGIRTLESGAARYNPMSYHNGSVWPHDNAIIAAGFANYGLKHHLANILNDFLDAAVAFELHRLPELFCGFDRRAGKGPTRYPVACSPQAWSSAAVFLMLAACIGLDIDARSAKVRLNHAFLPRSIDELLIRDLQVGTGSVDLALRRYDETVGVYVTRRTGDIEIIASK